MKEIITAIANGMCFGAIIGNIGLNFIEGTFLSILVGILVSISLVIVVKNYRKR